MDTFHEPPTYDSHVETISEQIIDIARHIYEQAGDFRIRMR